MDRHFLVFVMGRLDLMVGMIFGVMFMDDFFFVVFRMFGLGFGVYRFGSVGFSVELA